MGYTNLLLFALATYVIFCKAFPYFLYPNYLRKSKIENYPELKEVANKLRGVDRFQTLENVYRYMQQRYTGYGHTLKIKNLLSVFKLGDFSTKEILHKKQFLWCHTQNRLFKSILVNTGMFGKNEVVIGQRLLVSFFVHQWLFFELEGKKIIVDPYYGLFRVESK